MTHRAQRYNASHPWEVEDLPDLFVEMAPVNLDISDDTPYPKDSPEFAEYVKENSV